MAASTPFRLFCVFIIIFVAGLNLARAEEKVIKEPDIRVVHYHSNYYLNADFSIEKKVDVAVKVLQDRFVEAMKTRRFSYSTSMEELDITEAYTQKPDGSKLKVPKDSYQLRINQGRKDGGPAFSDRSTLTVVFPEVEVNDTLVISYIRTQKEPMFPGQFSATNSFGRSTIYDDVKVTVNLPADLHVNYKARQMEIDEKTQDGRKLLIFSYSNPKAIRSSQQKTVYHHDDRPGFDVSTFDNYEQVAKAYGKRALPKAKPTERILKLAGEIVGDEKDKREKARLLYEWVAKNIDYAGNCIGVGAVVPRDLDVVLDNRLGDCKDNATLLQALLEAEGIDAVQVLVNSGSYYDLPEVAMVGSVNHVMDYLPEFDLYVDATSDSTPFSMLPFQVMDKPVLPVEGYKSGVRTPKMQYKKNHQSMDTVLHIQADGSVKGHVEVENSGFSAMSIRAAWRDSSKEQKDKWLEKVFESRGQKGIGSIDMEDPGPLKDSFSYSVDFEKQAFLEGTGAGAFYIMPIMPTASSVGSYISISPEPYEEPKVVCGNGSSKETYTYYFPDNVKILAVPDDFAISENRLSYKASYKQKGNKLRVTRVIEDHSPANLCDRELMNHQRETLKQIQDNLRSQVVYQR